MTVVDSPPGITSPSTRARSRRGLYRKRTRPRALERGEMFDDVALQRENAEPVGTLVSTRGEQLRFGRALRRSMPGIASDVPSERHASATTFGSL